MSDFNSSSRFALNPVNLDIQRSKFPRNHTHKTTANISELIPIFCQEVLPGDTWQLKTNKVIRLPALLTPFMDNLYCDFAYYFVPNRLTWEHWKQFLGDNDKTSWIPQKKYQIPTVKVNTYVESPPDPTTCFEVGDIADYMGVPTYRACEVSALPFRALALIWNEWYRDENLQDPLVVNLGDESVDLTEISRDDIPDLEKPALGLGKLYSNKLHDFFTSSLPSPQKGPDVRVNLGGAAPVISDDLRAASFSDIYDAQDPLHFGWLDGTVRKDASGGIGASNSNDIGQAIATNASITEKYPVFADNLVALLDQANGVTINELRIAFQLQKFYERCARGGTRYTELLRSFFSVNPPDASLQRPEFLGGNRLPIHVTQVIQQSETVEEQPLGNLAATSLTTDSHHDFTKSFTEHGYIIGVMTCRYEHTYQQGLDKMWSRRDPFDFYWPVFANLGEMPVLNKEIYLSGTAADEEVFGYQEAWAEYRYAPNRVSAFMRTAPSTEGSVEPPYQSIDSWHLADYYASQPYLSSAWIKEDSNPVNRVLAVSERAAGFQYFADLYFQCSVTRPMPLYSVPGLIDHH